MLCKIMLNKEFRILCIAGLILSISVPGYSTSFDQLYKDFIIQRMMIAKIREYNGDPTANSLKSTLKREAENAGMDIPKWFSSSNVHIKYRAFQKSSSKEMDQLIDKASRTHGVSRALIKAVIRAESAFNPKAVSRAGAKGAMQIMDGTAQEIGLINPFDPEANILGGTKLLKKYLLKYRSVKKTLIAYNAGESYLSNPKKLPEETRNYIKKVIKFYYVYK